MKNGIAAETIITIEPNLIMDFQVTGEEGLETLCAMVRASWKNNQPLIITAKRVIFQPEVTENDPGKS